MESVYGSEVVSQAKNVAVNKTAVTDFANILFKQFPVGYDLFIFGLSV